MSHRKPHEPRSRHTKSGRKGSVLGNLPKKKRTACAPQIGDNYGPGALISVELDEDEEVQWEWTHFTDGRSYVTGYTIIKKID